MVWAVLFVAGLFEIGWAIGLKQTDGFARPVPAFVYVSMFMSVALLGAAMKVLPVGTAYAVWTGIGTLGTAFLGMCWFGEPRTYARFGFIGLILAGVVGLNLSTDLS
jgi:quaternary ammonium compound-resistance protein SugE